MPTPQPPARPPAHRLPRRWLAALAGLLAASLACNALNDFLTLEGPEDLATDAFGFPASATPRASLTPGPSATPQPTLAAGLDLAAGPEAALRPEFAADAGQFEQATRYTLDVEVAFDGDSSARLGGRQHIRFVNPHSGPLDELALMLWPNHGEQYLSEMTLSHLLVDGQPAAYALEQGGLVVRIPLEPGLAPGAAVEVSSEFSVRVFSGISSGSPARFGLTRGVLIAPTFYPLVPRLVDGTWQTQPASGAGDTTSSDTALYTWRVTAPAGLTVAATGSLVDESEAGGRQTQTLVAGPVRDLALAVGPLARTSREVEGVTLNAYVLAEHAAYADEMLDYAAGQMATLQARVGPYPFEELDIVDAPGASGGIEYPGLVFIGVVGPTDFFERATVHEVGHQWFYSLVGNDQRAEPWLDEAAASYTEVLYAQEIHGPEAAQAALREFRQYVGLASSPDTPIGLPVSQYASEQEYGLIVYGKGALFFAALRERLGDDVFFEFLREYYSGYRYGFANSAAFQASAEAACACELDSFFDLWVFRGGPIR